MHAAAGINHGVEIYSSVVEYATAKANKFKAHIATKRTPFTTPRFAAGNCYYLDPAAQRYDRIYVGACVEDSVSYESLLQLLKPGGTMVLPYRSELRKVETEKNNGGSGSAYGNASRVARRDTVLTRVSFRSLILPEGTAPLFGIGGG